jgi:hypothetical protein
MAPRLATSRRDICSGRRTLAVELPPSYPQAFRPMPQSVPSFFTNKENLSPSAAATTLLATATGTSMEDETPMPNWPQALSPIPQSVASPFTNSEVCFQLYLPPREFNLLVFLRIRALGATGSINTI